MAFAGCALDKQGAPSLTGPSELALSLTTTATPDLITQDGASQSTIQVVARGPNGQPWTLPLQVRAEVRVGGLPVDFGTLSSKSISIAPDGRGTITYTAPPPPPSSVGFDTVVTVVLTPVGTNYGNTHERFVEIRLARPGVVLPPNGTPVPKFVASPTSPRVGDKVFFDGTSSVDFDGTIVSYQWAFGDGDTGSGPTVEHSYDLAGTYKATLTVTDDRGLKATSAPVDIAVDAVDLPTADFTASPETAEIGDNIHFNGLLSQAAFEHEIVTYLWDFGDGSPLVTGATADHVYTKAGTFSVVLKVTDNFGLSHAVTKTVTINAP
jgi:PKD repeat protein